MVSIVWRLQATNSIAPLVWLWYPSLGCLGDYVVVDGMQARKVRRAGPLYGRGGKLRIFWVVLFRTYEMRGEARRGYGARFRLLGRRPTRKKKKTKGAISMK